MWHITYYDDDTGYAYRIRVKRLTVGDAVQMDTLSDEITRRESLHGRELLTLSQQYPFVRYCTAVCERAILDDAPDTNEAGDPVIGEDAEWGVFEVTEAVFMALPEWLSLQWNHEAVKKNPHRDPTYEVIKKKMLMERLQQPSAPSTLTEPSIATPSASASSPD